MADIALSAVKHLNSMQGPLAQLSTTPYFRAQGSCTCRRSQMTLHAHDPSRSERDNPPEAGKRGHVRGVITHNHSCTLSLVVRAGRQPHNSIV